MENKPIIQRLLQNKNILLVLFTGMLPVIFRNNSYFLLLLCTTGISIIVVSGLDILFGYSGQISLGHAAFYCIGAYTSAILSLKYQFPVFLTIFSGAIVSTLCAIIIAIPAVKLVHHFLALVTISFGQLTYLFVANAKNLTEGYSGMNFIPRPSIGSFEFESHFSFFYIVYFFLLIFLIVKWRLINSSTGRAFIAIRENLHAAEGMGINSRKYKVMAFAVSAFFTGFGGALYAHLIGFISPESFEMNQSVIFLTMLLFGGMGNMYGPILGAIALTVVSEYLQKLGSYQMLAYGIFLLFIVVYIPSGISKGLNAVQLFIGKRRGKGDYGHVST
jgi:branched-chain amino acid transport system permease protein